MAALDMQIRYVGNVFDKIYFSIFGKVTPVREAKLTGIQLTDNLNPKIGKKKNREEGVTHIAMDEDGNDVMVYHARTEAEINGDPLYNPNRHAMLMKVKWDEAGRPVFSYENK